MKKTGEINSCRDHRKVHGSKRIKGGASRWSTIRCGHTALVYWLYESVMSASHS